MSWWNRLWRRKQMEEQLEKELRFHIEQHTAELISQGYDPQEAARALKPLPYTQPEAIHSRWRECSSMVRR